MGGTFAIRTHIPIELTASHHGGAFPSVTRGMTLPFTLKSILRQKLESPKLKYFTMPKYNLHKIL
jgi:hypothetical protein